MLICCLYRFLNVVHVELCKCHFFIINAFFIHVEYIVVLALKGLRLTQFSKNLFFILFSTEPFRNYLKWPSGLRCYIHNRKVASSNSASSYNSSRLVVFWKKNFCTGFAKFVRKHFYWILLLNTVTG